MDMDYSVILESYMIDLTPACESTHVKILDYIKKGLQLMSKLIRTVIDKIRSFVRKFKRDKTQRSTTTTNSKVERPITHKNGLYMDITDISEQASHVYNKMTRFLEMLRTTPDTASLDLDELENDFTVFSNSVSDFIDTINSDMLNNKQYDMIITCLEGLIATFEKFDRDLAYQSRLIPSDLNNSNITQDISTIVNYNNQMITLTEKLLAHVESL